MLSPAKVAEVEQLLASGGLSQRAIARRTGVSRGTVAAIAAGTRRKKPLRPVAGPPFDIAAPLKRCPQCGGRVHLPCWACAVEAIKRSRGYRPFADRPAAAGAPAAMVVGLDLRPEHQRRYQRTRRRMLRRLRRWGEWGRGADDAPSADAPSCDC